MDSTTMKGTVQGYFDRLEKASCKAAKPPAAGCGGDKKLTADEWQAEELKKGK